MYALSAKKTKRFMNILKVKALLGQASGGFWVAQGNVKAFPSKKGTVPLILLAKSGKDCANLGHQGHLGLDQRSNAPFSGAESGAGTWRGPCVVMSRKKQKNNTAVLTDQS